MSNFLVGDLTWGHLCVLNTRVPCETVYTATKKTRRRQRRVHERDSTLQQEAYPEERRNYAKFFVGLGYRGKQLRNMVILATLVSAIVGVAK